jgi:hypothetical protein
MRDALRRLIEGSKLLADRRLQGAKTEGFVPSVVFTALREIEPFLRHFDERTPESEVCLATAKHSAAMRLRSRDRSPDIAI